MAPKRRLAPPQGSLPNTTGSTGVATSTGLAQLSGSRIVAKAAADNVEGYLRNASRRMRVPVADGGRGTRRKLALVTSADTRRYDGEETPAAAANKSENDRDESKVAQGGDSSLVNPDGGSQDSVLIHKDVLPESAVDDADDSDWDDVALPFSLLPVATTDNRRFAKKEEEPGSLPDGNQKAPLTSTKLEAPSSELQHAHEVDHPKAKFEGIHDVDANEASTTFDPLTSIPQLQQQRRPWGSSNDPAYEAMLEQRDLLNAKRRSERIVRVGTTVLQIAFLIQRGVRLFRQAHHTFYARGLLHLEAPLRDENSGRTGAEDSTPDHSEGTRRRQILRAVQEARHHAEKANIPGNATATLGPSWVTRKSDNIKNHTSAGIKSLLESISATFVLDGRTTGDILSSWSAPIEMGVLYRLLVENTGLSHGIRKKGRRKGVKSGGVDLEAGAAKRKNRVSYTDEHYGANTLNNNGGRRSKAAISQRIALPHALHFCIIFISLARLSNMICRLVIAKKDVNVSANTSGHQTNRDKEAVDQQSSRGPEPISIFGPATRKRKRVPSPAGIASAALSIPSSCFWVEVWCPQRLSYISVNPCENCTTVWGAPYTFAFGGSEVVDVTPRYISKYSTAFGSRLSRCSQLRFIWRHLSWSDNRDGVEVLLEPFNKDLIQRGALRREREAKQLSFLMYSEPVPTTLTALKRHPLFVIESDLPRAEAVYPRDSSIVGSVKSHTVYKREAVVTLRSRDGWLREGRSLLGDTEQPYKTMPPPSSRPFAQHSCFYGVWQTKPFEPANLCTDGSFPQHGRTNWYIVLKGEPAKGIAHVSRPMISRVARRMQLDFRIAVVSFIKRQINEQRRGHWEVVTDGIVVKESELHMLLHAYDEWVRLNEEQEATRRRQRSFHWWMLLSQRLLAADRLKQQYLQGVMHGGLARH